MAETYEPAKVVRDEAHHLRLIANNLRLAGDIPLVQLNNDGITPAHITLADELWLIAARLDPERMLDDRYDPDKPRADPGGDR